MTTGTDSMRGKTSFAGSAGGAGVFVAGEGEDSFAIVAATAPASPSLSNLSSLKRQNAATSDAAMMTTDFRMKGPCSTKIHRLTRFYGVLRRWCPQALHAERERRFSSPHTRHFT